jgi:hypothetical protein
MTLRLSTRWHYHAPVFEAHITLATLFSGLNTVPLQNSTTCRGPRRVSKTRDTAESTWSMSERPQR